jgi:AAA15 family ATPase/GTPase
MLIQFNVKNHKSIADELSIDFSAVKSLQDNKQFVCEDGGLRLLPVAALYGNNASGKTNILDALAFMMSCVISSSIERLREKMKATPYIFQPEYSFVESSYEVFISAEGKEYQYGFALSGDKIVHEWLYSRKISAKTDTVWKTLFSRSVDGYVSDRKQHLKLVNSYAPLIDDELLALSFLAHRDTDAVDDYKNVFDAFVSIRLFSPSFFPIEPLLSQYDYNPGLLERACDFIQAFDPMFEKLEFSEEMGSDGKKSRRLSTKHKGVLYPVDFESDGTAKLITFLTGYFTALDDGGVLIVDELDCQLHPLIVRKIVRSFHDKSINTRNAQLLFSSHNLIVLNNQDLRRDEIWFVEKDENGKTTASSLADFECDTGRFRADMNYSKNYLAGVFGAIPFQSNEG